jgi:hypothetical protein
MNDHFRFMQQEASAVTQEWRRQGHDRDMRVATWLLVGNGAALLFCFNAAMSHNICDWSKVQPFAIAFFLGMVWAISNVVLSGDVIDRASQRLQLISGAAREVSIAMEANNLFRGVQSPDSEVVARIAKNDEVIEQAMKTMVSQRDETVMEKRRQLQANWCLVFSALVLAGSILAAIVTQAIPSALCPAAVT